MMKRSTKLALTLVLAVGAAVPAMAQDNFPDVPANHWAFDALVKMKADGLLVGYPDGLFRGARPASRYELAVAMNAVYSHLKSLIDGMQTQLDLIKGINPQDIANLKDQVAHLQDEINAMKGWGDDIAALKKATEEFDKELRSLGVDVEAMKKDLGDLQERVSRLEKKKAPVDISGDVGFYMATTNGDTHGHYGLTTDGELEGKFGTASNGNRGLFKDLTFLHEGAFTISGTNETGPKWKGTVVIGNALNANGWGTQSTFATGGATQTFGEGKEDVYIQDLSIKQDIKVAQFSFNAEAGRVAYSTSPYMFMRPQFESYFSNERWDDGKYRLDGAILGFNFGAAKLHVWGGNTSNLNSVNGTDLNAVYINNTRSVLDFVTPSGGTGTAAESLAQVDRVAAADLGIGLGKNGHLSLGYLLLESDRDAGSGFSQLITPGANRDSIVGGDADLGFGRFKVSGGFHQSSLLDNGDSINSKNSQSWDAKAKYTADKFNVYGGYRSVDKDYFAPGDWGRLGFIQNPGNIHGWQGGAYLDLTKAIRLTAEGEWDKGYGSQGSSTDGTALGSSPFYKDTNIRQLTARVDFRLNPNFSVFGSYQDLVVDNLSSSAYLGGPGFSGDNTSAMIDWTTVGLGYGLSSNAKFTLQYQFSNGGDYLTGTPGERLNGGILTSQLTIKF